MLRTKKKTEFEMVQLQSQYSRGWYTRGKEMMEYSEESYKSLSDGFDALMNQVSC